MAELYKIVFQNKKSTYKYIPVVTTILGGILGIMIYYIDPELIMSADNPFMAFLVGLVSGLTSTGTNQVLKQLTSNDQSK